MDRPLDPPTTPDVDPRPQVEVRPDTAWDDYRQEAKALEGLRYPRLFFADGTLVLVGPTSTWFQEIVAVVQRVIEHGAATHEVLLRSFGQGHQVSEAACAAATPEASYQLGERRADTHPTLVLDHPALPDAAWRAYARLGIPAVVTVDDGLLGTRGAGQRALRLYELRDGEYVAREAGPSPALAGFDVGRVGRAVAAGLEGTYPTRDAAAAFDRARTKDGPRPSAVSKTIEAPPDLDDVDG